MVPYRMHEGLMRASGAHDLTHLRIAGAGGLEATAPPPSNSMRRERPPAGVASLHKSILL